MNEPRIGLARQTARNIIEGAKITRPPILLNNILSYLRNSLKLNILKSDFKEGLDGISTETDEAAFLAYNGNVSTNRARSTIAHELGHICLHHEHPGNIDRFEITEKQAESEAWTFARELLMPLSLFKKDLQTLRSVPKLSQLYRVSDDMLRSRIQELHLEMSIWEW